MKITTYLVTALMLLGALSGICMNDVSAAEVPGKCTGVHISVILGYITMSGNMPANHVEADIKGLHVYRGTTEGNLTLHDTVTAYYNTVTFFLYQDTHTDNGVKYFYRVAAFNDQGDGELSDLMNATVNGIPPKPNDLVAIADYDLIELTWLAPISDGGKPITNYSVFRGTGGAEPVWIANTTTLSYTDDNVSALDGMYDYEVCAVNDYGAGKRSLRVFVEMAVPSINGTIIGEDLSPIDGVKVEMDGNASSVVTGTNGTFSFLALPGTHVIRVWADDRMIYSVNVTMAEAPKDLGGITISSLKSESASNGDMTIYAVVILAIMAVVIVGILVMRRRKT